MIYRLMIFLVLCSVAGADRNIGCLVGGSSASNTNAGWFNSDLIAVADTFSPNGGPVDNKDGSGNVTNDGGSVLITDTDQFGDTTVGMFVYVDFTDDVHADGRYEITQLIDDDSIGISLAYIGDEAVDVWRVGGAALIIDGIFGLQNVLDDALSSAAANNVDIYIAGSDTATTKILLDAGGGTSAGTIKRLVGVNSSYVNDGTLAVITINTANMGPGSPLFQIDDISYVTLENIHINITGDAATAGEDCFQIANGTSQAVVNFYNCKATNGYRGFNYDGDAPNRMSLYELIDCTSTGSVVEGMRLVGIYWKLDRCYIEASSTYAIYSTNTQSEMDNCIIDGGGTGLWYNSTGAWASVTNCSFYNQTVSCIGANGARDIGLTVYNNLFWVADINTVFPILNTDGVIYMIYEDWNFTNADSTRSSMLTGANSQNALWSDTETNLWTDAVNNDFTVVDASMIDGGMPTLSDEGGTPADGYSTPGAAQLAQTQAGGGGGNVVIIRRQ